MKKREKGETVESIEILRITIEFKKYYRPLQMAHSPLRKYRTRISFLIEKFYQNTEMIMRKVLEV